MQDKAIGDLSKADRRVLTALAGERKRILEGGVGASTQILTHYTEGTVVSYDTDVKWIDRIRSEVFPEVGVVGNCTFKRYEVGSTKIEGRYDLAFVDLEWVLRLEFALKAWPCLVPGGLLVFHDAKRSKDIAQALHFFAVKYREVAHVEICPDDSNFIIFTKRDKRCDNVNWHETEGWTDKQLGIDWLLDGKNSTV